MAEAVVLPSVRAGGRPYDMVGRRRAWDQILVALQEERGFSLELAMPEVGREQRDVLLGLFDLPEESLWTSARHSVRPDSHFAWVGYGYHSEGSVTLHRTFDLGPWGAASAGQAASSWIPTAEVTPLPPDLTAEWLPASHRLRTALGATGRALVSLIASGLGCDPLMAAARFQPDHSTMRILEYPELGHPESDQLRAGEHEDSGALTFIWSDAPGLQVRTAWGDWIDAEPDSWTVICGAVMSEMTGRALAATTHRVIPGPGRRRSLAYFFEPSRTSSVLPWPAVGKDAPEPSRAQTYGPWWARRHGA